MEIWTNPECLRLLCDWERLKSAGLRSSELFVPARHFVARHDLVTRILVKVRRIRRSLHLWRDGWVEAAAIEALPVEALEPAVLLDVCHAVLLVADLSTGFSRQKRFIRVTAVLLTFLGTVIWSKPLRMML